jgi:hypothetical protein
VGDPAKTRVHIQAKKPRLGDVISTEFVLEIEGFGQRHYAANLPDNSGLYSATCKETGVVRVVQLVEKTNYGSRPARTFPPPPPPAASTPLPLRRTPLPLWP